MTNKHIIYGYKTLLEDLPKWKIGATLKRTERCRFLAHRRANSFCPLFDEYLRYKLAKRFKFEDVFEYHILHEENCDTRKCDELWAHYTIKYNAIYPNGFNLKAGGYNGSRDVDIPEHLSRYYYNINEAADVLGSRSSTVHRMVKIGQLSNHQEYPGLISKYSVENYLLFKRLKYNPFIVSAQNKTYPLWVTRNYAARCLVTNSSKIAELAGKGLINQYKMYSILMIYMPSLIAYKKRNKERYKKENLTLKEAANYANMTYGGIRFLVKRGKLNFISSSPKRISKKDLDEYLRSKAIKKVLSNSSYRYEEAASHLDRCAKILKNLNKLGLIDKALP